jgi:hypothetical protein
MDGETSQTFTPATSGEYAVIVNQGSCTSISECESILIVDLDEPINRSIKLFPNPVQDVLLVETDAERLGSVYSIFDCSGKKVSSGSIETTNAVVRLNNLPNGVYMIKFESLKEVVSIRFVKN